MVRRRLVMLLIMKNAPRGDEGHVGKPAISFRDNIVHKSGARINPALCKHVTYIRLACQVLTWFASQSGEDHVEVVVVR